MHRTILSIFVFACILSIQTFAQQSIQLFNEDFNGPTHKFSLNTADTSVTQNFGVNQWVVNDAYDGGNLYPNTPDQSNTVSGTITGAPFSKYLHIYDNGNATVAANAAYDPAVPSDRFVKMTNGFCTLGMTDVIFSFFWIAGGNADDYGEIYYSVDGGDTWIKTGNDEYNNQPLWRYSTITDPAFEGVADLRFGFRWVNNSATPDTGISFGIDDIIVVGKPSQTVELNITNVFPNPVCRGNFMTVIYNISEPICGGSFVFEISNGLGDFSTPSSLGVINVAPGTQNGAVGLLIPTNAFIASCYRIRMVRMSPSPQIVGNGSVCIETIDCEHSTTAMQPVIDMGPDTMCINSIISIPFYSTGAYLVNNEYIAELSDSSGSFDNPTVIGQNPDSETYDPAVGSDPGSVGGLVPEVPPGCNYYIRIMATSPGTNDSLAFAYGPICIRECDILTNEMQAVQLCINELYGDSALITIDINSWNTDAEYLAGNEFQVQLLDPEDFSIINTGVLGSIAAVTDTTLLIYAPPLADLLAMGIQPGDYLMRIIATNSSEPYDVLGTVVPLSIGSPSIEPPVILAADSILCTGEIINLLIDPFNDESEYEWFSPVVNFGDPFFWEFNPLLITTSNAGTGTFSFTVREHNYGCAGEWSDSTLVELIGVPNVNIQAQTPICQGDTVTFSVEFIETTFYDWSVSFGEIIDISNHVVTVYFPDQGSFNVSVDAVNICGSTSGSRNFQVRPNPFMTAGNDTIVCPGEEVLLNSNSSGNTYYWFLNGDTIGTTPAITVNPEVSGIYTSHTINQFGCTAEVDVDVEVHQIPELAGDDVALCSGGTETIGAEAIGGFVYNWIPDTGISDPQDAQPTITIVNTTGQDILLPYALMVTDTNKCNYTDSVWVTVFAPAEAFAGDDITITEGESVSLNASGGTTCFWHPPLYLDDEISCSPLATPDSTITYYLSLTDDNGCYDTDSVTITVEPLLELDFDIAVPNVFAPSRGGINGLAGVFVDGEVQLNYFRIFNRWGEMVFETNDPNIKWDGTYNGTLQPTGNYVFLLSAQLPDGNRHEEAGEIILVK